METNASRPASRAEVPERQAVTGVRTVIICLALLLEGMSSSSITVQVAAIQADLEVSPVLLSFLAGAFLIAYAGVLPASGRVVDTVGSRRMFMIGVGAFGVGCLLCALAPGPWVLVLGRIVQGTGAAVSAPAAMVLITHGLAERHRDKAVAVYAAMGAVGFSLGLVLPGFVVSLLGWRMSFAVLTPVVVLILLVARGVPSRSPQPGNRVDAVGSLLLTVVLMVAMHALGGASTLHPGVLGAEVAVIGAGVFALVRRGGIVGFPEHVARSPKVLGPCIALAAVNAGSVASMFVLSLGLQHLNGLSAFAVGLIIVPQPLCFSLLARPCTHLLGVIGAPRTIAIGASLLVASLVVLTMGGALAAPVWLVMITMGGIGASLACTFPAASIAVIGASPERDRGSAAGLVTSAQNFGGALGLALIALTGWVPTVGAAHSVAAPLLAMAALMVSALMVVVGCVVAVLVGRRPDAPRSVRIRLPVPR